MINNDVKLEILKIGAEIIHKQGYNNTSINDICKAADIPKGSFYYYFGSKEDYATALIEFYYNFMFSMQIKYLDMDGESSIKRLRSFFEDFKGYFINCRCSKGCPIGNLAQELSDSNEILREKLALTLEKTKRNIELFLEQAQNDKEISQEIDICEMADFIFNSWEGSLLRMKATKNIAPMELFDKMIFEVFLGEKY